MILTPIPRRELSAALDKFAAGLRDPLPRRLFCRIRATSPDRAVGRAAARDRLAVLAFSRRCGLRVHPPDKHCRFNWDGQALNGGTEAYVILHEIAHFVLAPPARRHLIEFGLGPGPDTRGRAEAARAAVLPSLPRDDDEAMASLLGIVWEAGLGQPALASFLDQNWLEGLDRSAAGHFTAIIGRLSRRRLLRLADRAMPFGGEFIAASESAATACAIEPARAGSR